MAQMIPQKHEIAEFNGGTGEQYGLQISDASDFTKIVENATFASDLVNNLANATVDNSEANQVGTAQITIEGTSTNRYFKVKNIKGATGATGPTGQTGATGNTPNIQVGNVTTLETGQSATASMGGTVDNPLLNLGLPKGNVGSQGQQGKSFNPRGEWISGENYINDITTIDVVYYDGNSYYCKLSNSSTVNPFEDTTNWGLLTSGVLNDLVKSIDINEEIEFTRNTVSYYVPTTSLRNHMTKGSIVGVEWSLTFSTGAIGAPTHTYNFDDFGVKHFDGAKTVSLDYITIKTLTGQTTTASYQFVISSSGLSEIAGPTYTIYINKIRYIETTKDSAYRIISTGGGGGEVT